MKKITEKIRKEVESFFEIGEQIVVGVSGGADSLTLLDSLANSKKNFNLIVAHLNHELRGKEALKDQQLVEEYCKKKDLFFVLKKEEIGKIAKEKKISIEECGRIKRYEFFKSLGGTIATAHTLSDLTETFLINILRGCSLKGLLSIPKKRDNIVRPLLEFKREEIEQYCKENSIKFAKDSTNFEEKFLRNKLRLKVIPILKQINPSFEKNLLNTINSLKLDEEFLDFVATQHFNLANKQNFLSLNCVNRLKSSIKFRVLAKFLKQNSVEITNKLLVRVLNLCEKGFGQENLKKNKFVVLKKGKLKIKTQKDVKSFNFLLPNCFECSYENLYFVRCKKQNYNYFLNNVKYLFLFKFDYDKIVGDVYLRSKKAKDRIKLKKRPTKTLKALMQEKGLLKQEREKTFVLADDIGVFWVWGFGLDVRVLPNEKSENLCLVFEKL